MHTHSSMHTSHHIHRIIRTHTHTCTHNIQTYIQTHTQLSTHTQLPRPQQHTLSLTRIRSHPHSVCFFLTRSSSASPFTLTLTLIPPLPHKSLASLILVVLFTFTSPHGRCQHGTRSKNFHRFVRFLFLLLLFLSLLSYQPSE